MTLSAVIAVILAAPFLAAAVVDVRTRRIPNALSAAAVVLGLGVALAAGQGLEAALGALAALAAGAGLHLLARGAFGMGDVKLMAGGGAIAGLPHVLDFLAAMALAGGVAALGILIARRGRGGTMPYGPAIAAGAIAAIALARA